MTRPLEPRDLRATLAMLAEQRPVFHSEADFQHSLAWSVRERHPGIDVRLEYPTPWDERRGAIDIRLRAADGAAAIELKYWTRAAELTAGGERFDLKDQGKQPPGRYDFWKDVARTERLVGDEHADGGYVIALTNERGYWNKGRAGTIDAAFRMHDGREVRGTLAWSGSPSPGTTDGRESPLDLRGEYVVRWRNYSRPAPGNGGEFRYLLLDVGEGLRAAR